MGKVGGRASDEDSVEVNHTVQFLDVDFVSNGVNVNMVNFDAKVATGFVKSCMNSYRDNPGKLVLTLAYGRCTRRGLTFPAR